MSEVCVNNVLCLCRLSNKQLIDQYFQKINLYIRLERDELELIEQKSTYPFCMDNDFNFLCERQGQFILKDL